eukprot:jgi/Ulvmu1/462/UM001_0469.1
MQNNFAALSSAQEPAQMIAQATNAAKNRRKKEKAKMKKAAANKPSEETDPSGSEPSVAPENGSTAPASAPDPKPASGMSDSLDSVTSQLKTEAMNLDCWGVWDEWSRRIGSEKTDRKYKDRNGRRFSFLEAMISSGALARSVGNCAHINMMPADKTQLETLLQACFAESHAESKNIAAVAFEVSQSMQASPQDAKVAAAGALQSIVTHFQKATELASSATAGTDLSKIEAEILQHMPLLHKAISQPDSIKAHTINTGMHVAQLLRDKYEAEKVLSAGQVPSICLAAKSDAQKLSSILTMQALAPASGKGRAGRQDDGVVAALMARISALEAELTACRVELQDALAAQSGHDNGHAVPAAASAAAAQQIVERVEAAVTTAANVPIGHAGNADDTLMQLMEHSRNCAQMQDKLMGRLGSELEFARTRLLNASKMNNQSGVATARELLSGVRATSAEIHDAAARLEALVATLDTHVGGSPAYSALRPMSMQVKHIAAQVYAAHKHLTARAWPDAILEEATSHNGKRSGRSIPMHEILSMDVGGKGGKGEAATAASHASLDPASGVATQGSTVSTPAADAQSPPQSGVMQPPVGQGMPVMPRQQPPVGAVPPGHLMAPPGMMPMAAVPAGYVFPQPVGGQPMHALVAPMQQPGMLPGHVVSMAPMHAPNGDGVPTVQGVPVHQELPVGPSARFGSSLAAAEEAAANLSKLLPPSQGHPSAGRAGSRAGLRGGRGGRRA